MIPLELKLTNFLSYGESAPALNLEPIRVACLSGRNGQGKSALLDALTWALWGQARKSSGNHKPDDELIRIGTQRMQVELTFRVEEGDYRVTRAYTRSRSGKSSTPSLELAVRNEETGVFRPLTGGAARETQQRINEVVGIDFDTFINSAMLLQGRSDEFTKRKASERKDILANILNLGRFDGLSQRSREKERDAASQLAKLQTEVERLTKETAEKNNVVPLLQKEKSDLKENQEKLNRLRIGSRDLIERLAKLDSLEKQVQQQQQGWQQFTKRRADLQAQADSLRGQMAAAEALIADRAVIERNFKRYKELSKRRDDLDVQREQHRGLELIVNNRRAELKESEAQFNRKIESLERDLRADRQLLGDCDMQMAELPALRRQISAAQQAQRALTDMTVIANKRAELEYSIEQAKNEVEGLFQSLTGQRSQLRLEIEKATEALPDLSKLKRQHALLEVDAAKLEEQTRLLQNVQEEGQRVSETIQRLRGALESAKVALAQKCEDWDRLRREESAACPVCGSGLTADHRREVEAQFGEAVAKLEQTVAEGEAAISAQAKLRHTLGSRYKEVEAVVAGLKEAPQRRASLRAQLDGALKDAERIETLRRQQAALDETLASKNYALEQRALHRKLCRERDGLAFDKAAYDRLQAEAAGLEVRQNRLRQLEQVQGRREQLDRAIQQKLKEEAELRRQLDARLPFAEQERQLAHALQQLETVGFDPEHFEQVRAALRELAGAGDRMMELVNAQNNLDDWKDRHTRVTDEIQHAEAEMQRLCTAIETLQAALAERPALEAAHQTHEALCRDEEEHGRQLQIRVGELGAQLQQIKRQEERLAACRQEISEAAAQHQVYKHLSAAFGRNGIPSLIIEEALPEIQSRTNDLLQRLTDGRMSISLVSQRERRDGSAAETLDIHIQDETGASRFYETFSGGEAFRVNFALRIALSQLLAERNGVRIRTLFIDEGFGTQDLQGVENLIQAIDHIREDFDKIIVITHMDQLKEAFPVRIEVVKDPVTGSSFQVLES